MTIGKPRGRSPSLIGSTLGTPKLVTIAKSTPCKRCGTALHKGLVCYAIPQLGGAFTNLRRYCTPCFRNILQKTKEDLESLISKSDALV